MENVEKDSWVGFIFENQFCFLLMNLLPLSSFDLSISQNCSSGLNLFLTLFSTIIREYLFTSLIKSFNHNINMSICTNRTCKKNVYK